MCLCCCKTFKFWDHPSLHIESSHLASLSSGASLQERLTSGYYSLAQRLEDTQHVNVTVAPAGLAWQQVYKLSRGKTAEELPEGERIPFRLRYTMLLG